MGSAGPSSWTPRTRIITGTGASAMAAGIARSRSGRAAQDCASVHDRYTSAASSQVPATERTRTS